MERFTELWNGEVGVVVEGDDWDDEKGCIVLDGKEYDIVDEIGGIDEFLEENGVDNLVLYRGFAYRGEGCYSGSMKVGEKMYSLDIMNEYMVCELEERNN